MPRAQVRSMTAGPLVLGIDPGTRVVGWGLVRLGGRQPVYVDCGVVRASAREALPKRLGKIRAGIDEVLGRFSPSVVVVEEAFAAKNVQSALRIGEGRGVVLACASTAGAEIVQFAPAVAKKAVVGHGAAHKSQVAAMVTRLLQLRETPEPDDATDALALALGYALRSTSPGAGLPRAATGRRRSPILPRSTRPRT